jgi:nicotinamide-nucleotide amidase
MKAEVLIIGDEILLGQIVDTNSVFIARRLAEFGVRIHRIAKVGDDESAIVDALDDATRHAEIVIACGGLGPTHDDRTRSAVARFLGSELRTNAEALAAITERFVRAGRRMSKANEVQALVPDGAAWLANDVGTAPGLQFSKGATTFFCIQGVPREMEWMVATHVLPYVRQRVSGHVLRWRTIHVTAVPESTLYDGTRDVIREYRGRVEVAFLPKLSRGVDLRLTVHDMDADTANRLIAEMEGKLVARIDEKFRHAVYGFDDETMEDVVAELFFRSGKTIATAESCTGGLVAHRLTNISGSSRYFLQGFTTYSNESKIRELGIDASLIERYGAVSEEVAAAMAVRVREVAGSDIGLAVTGIAGPTGGTPEKPVGTVHIALKADDHAEVYRPLVPPYPVQRIEFKERTSQIALDLVRKYLLSRLGRA